MVSNTNTGSQWDGNYASNEAKAYELAYALTKSATWLNDIAPAGKGEASALATKVEEIGKLQALKQSILNKYSDSAISGELRARLAKATDPESVAMVETLFEIEAGIEESTKKLAERMMHAAEEQREANLHHLYAELEEQHEKTKSAMGAVMPFLSETDRERMEELERERAAAKARLDKVLADPNATQSERDAAYHDYSTTAGNIAKQEVAIVQPYEHASTTPSDAKSTPEGREAARTFNIEATKDSEKADDFAQLSEPNAPDVALVPASRLKPTMNPEQPNKVMNSQEFSGAQLGALALVAPVQPADKSNGGIVAGK